MDEDICPSCGEDVSDSESWYYLLTEGVCKCCYDDFHFGAKDDEEE